ncbi:hypothetical protein [Kibdelosporangium aridum]|uniref:hypothetical protein n=1 Tax=Kibdelosporangium aridum TaxID=2030 RepID=UPI0021AE27EA|nr:hypothetical protein [Kibdelosporangium aridum]
MPAGVQHHFVEQGLRGVREAGGGEPDGYSGTQELGNHPWLAAVLRLGQHVVDLVDVLDLLGKSRALRDRQQLTGATDQPRVGLLIQRGRVLLVRLVAQRCTPCPYNPCSA